MITATPSYKEVKTENQLQDKYITIVLSNSYIEHPYPIKCLGCGYTIYSVNNLPQNIYMGKIEAADAGKSSDHRCKKCKITYRIY